MSRFLARLARAGLLRLGEIVTSTIPAGSAVALSTGTGANVTSIVLGAGTWDLRGQVDYVLTGVTGTLFQSGFSLVSGVLPTQVGGSGLGADPITQIPMITTLLSGTFGHPIKSTILVISATTTVYLVAQQTLTVGTSAAYGTLTAVRLK